MKYFSYGMNTNLDQMARRCPGAVCLGAAWINNYQFEFRTHADIEKKAGARCYGVLWDIDQTHVKALDSLEGFPYYYHKLQVMVNTDQYRVSAMTYQMVDQQDHAAPASGYLDMVTQGYHDSNVPTEQLAEAINRVCYLSAEINTELPLTQ